MLIKIINNYIPLHILNLTLTQIQKVHINYKVILII